MKPAVILIFLLLVGGAVRAQPAELRLAYIDQDLAPYLAGEDATVPSRPGMAVELAERCANHIGRRLTLTRLPLRRLIEETRAGRQDGIIGFRHSPERATDLVYPMRGDGPDVARHIARLTYALYHRKGGGITWDGRHLSGLTGPVAVGGSRLIADRLKALGAEVVRTDTGLQMFGMLNLGRVDAAVTLDLMADRLLRGQNNQQIEKVFPPLVVEEFYVPVSKAFYAANRDFTERFWQVMGELRDQTYAELSPNYLF